jgi:hypothetical protein
MTAALALVLGSILLHTGQVAADQQQPCGDL